MSIRVQLKNPKNQIEKISEQITNYLNTKLRKNYGRVVNSLNQKIPLWIREQPEIQSLLSEGIPEQLNTVFGLRPGDASRAVNDIISAIKSSTTISISKINQKYRGDISFGFQSLDFNNLLGLSSGYITTEKGEDLHWLDWLLMRGDSVIIVGYEYEPTLGIGRSGGGIMIKPGVFRVPPQYSGNPQDNFITRAFSNREREIQPIMMRLFE